MVRPRRVVAGAVVVIMASAGCGLVGGGAGSDRSGEAYTMEANASVVRVVDGDTLVVDIAGEEERVRLIGMDTPESVAPNRPVECFGAESTKRLEELAPPGTPLRLERDIEARDLYDRLLAYVYRAEDGLHLNLDQVVEGFAEAMPYPPNTALADDFAVAEREARAAGAGLWSACGAPDVPIGPPLVYDD